MPTICLLAKKYSISTDLRMDDVQDAPISTAWQIRPHTPHSFKKLTQEIFVECTRQGGSWLSQCLHTLNIFAISIQIWKTWFFFIIGRFFLSFNLKNCLNIRKRLNIIINIFYRFIHFCGQFFQFKTKSEVHSFFNIFLKENDANMLYGN